MMDLLGHEARPFTSCITNDNFELQPTPPAPLIMVEIPRRVLLRAIHQTGYVVPGDRHTAGHSKSWVAMRSESLAP